MRACGSAILLAIYLKKAREVYARMATEDVNEYRKLKAEILNAYAVSPCIYMRNFFSWTHQSSQTYEEHSRVLLEQLPRWFEGSSVVLPPAVAELLVRYRIDQQLPPDLALFLVDKDTVSLSDLVKVIDKHVLACKMLQAAQSRRKMEDSAVKTTPRLPAAGSRGRVPRCPPLVAVASCRPGHGPGAISANAWGTVETTASLTQLVRSIEATRLLNRREVSGGHQLGPRARRWHR